MSVQTFVLYIVPSLIFFGISTNGTACKTSRDCQPQEFCDHGSCRCSKGFVKYKEQCFPLKNYGEMCSYDVQCTDYRMICTNDENDIQHPMFCFCDPYHLWNSTLEECLEVSNMTQVGGNFREVYNVTGMIEKSAQKVFLGVVIAGIICVSILLSFIGICSIYGCCRKRKMGRYGENDVGKGQINEVAVIGLPSGTYQAIETDFSAMAAM